jgi:hypothetical protein
MGGQGRAAGVGMPLGYGDSLAKARPLPIRAGSAPLNSPFEDEFPAVPRRLTPATRFDASTEDLGRGRAARWKATCPGRRGYDAKEGISRP